jgi:molecular chaperone DnaJ
MMDDYYLLLGISRGSGLTEIRRAYRRLALRFHPEVAGDDGAEQFGRIRDAFDTLSRTSRRDDYDRRLEEVERTRGAARAARMLFADPVDVMRDFETVRPGGEEITRHVLGNFTGRTAKSNPARELNVEIVLSPEQAASGGQVTMLVPVARVCAVCGGTGRAGFLICDACTGQGTHWEKAKVDVHIPRGAADGTVVETSLRHVGIRNMWLKTHVRVAAGQA